MAMPTDPSLLSLDGSLGLLLPIAALLPLVAVLMVSQSNPYQTLPLRGAFGSVAMLLYGLLGAPDVALTEAMVGTLLSTTLYVIALRSSMTLRIEDRRTRALPPEEPDPDSAPGEVSDPPPIAPLAGPAEIALHDVPLELQVVVVPVLHQFEDCEVSPEITEQDLEDMQIGRAHV